MKKHLKTARTLAYLLDNQFNVMGFRFGLATLIDMIPVFGDFADALFSFYLVWIGIQMGLPLYKIAEMTFNVTLNFLLGGIPLVGEAIYALRKVNLKNLKILESYAHEDILEGQVI